MIHHDVIFDKWEKVLVIGTHTIVGRHIGVVCDRRTAAGIGIGQVLMSCQFRLDCLRGCEISG